RELGAHAAGGDLFADGSLGSHTACLGSRYDDVDTLGYAYLDAEQVAAHVTECTRVGLQAGFHAIGDAALSAVLDGYARSAQQVGLEVLRAARHRIEHVEIPLPRHVEQMARLGLVASVQPAFDARWGGPDGLYAARLGQQRSRDSNPLAALAAAGVPLAFGSDAPVTPLDPWGAVRAAVWHHNQSERLTVAEAFGAHTAGGFELAGRPGGVLHEGGPASYVVWDCRSAGLPTTEDGLPDLSLDQATELPVALRTVVDGHPTFRREGV
ncbi:MAG: amidohydrolase family protein, partial [Actinomycetota bacterium]|nr:amidohydrolase family protein [Actinomycetota bacterium]